MAIPYTDVSWNPITGCSPISAGCDHCWAAKMIVRHRDLPGYDHDNPFKPTFHPERLDQPRRWKKPKVIATCFMGDWCHGDVPAKWRDAVWKVMRDCPQHTFATSTKRPYLMVRELLRLGPLENVWHGVTVETQDIARLRMPKVCGISHLYVNYEPALGLIDWSAECGLDGLDGIIVGAESGPHARPFDPAWAESTLEACWSAGVKFYMKQLSPAMGGGNWDLWPASLKHLKVRELPWTKE